jgi:hypothetical protein
MKNKNKTSLIGKKTSRVIQLLLVFVLCLPVTTVLQLEADRQVQQPMNLQNQRKRRKEAFEQLAEQLNQLFRRLNYTSFEYQAKYFGTARSLRKYWQRDPLLEPKAPRRFYFGPNLHHSLKEDWVQIGRLVSKNGKKSFLPGRLLFNGTHLGYVTTAKSGSYKNKKIVHPYYFQSPKSFYLKLYQNAHPKYLSSEEAAALADEQSTFAERFEATLKNAHKKGSQEAWEQVANKFNAWTFSQRLAPLYTAKIVPKVKTAGYELLIGRKVNKEQTIIGSVNMTAGKRQTFEETISYHPRKRTFVIKESMGYLPLMDRKEKTTEELFDYLEKVAKRKRKEETQARKQATTTASKNPYDSSFGTKAYVPGELNSINFEDWSPDLLAVAVITRPADSTGNHLAGLLDEVMENQVYGFLDKFTFGEYQGQSWKTVLLNESTRLLGHYDILMVDDVNIDSWDEAWGLTSREKLILTEWIFDGGSLYLSSALSSQQSVVKDKFFPGDWLELRTKNVLLNSDFNLEVYPSNDYLPHEEDTGERYDGSWKRAKNENGEWFDWSVGSNDGNTNGERLAGAGNFSFYNSQANCYSYLTVNPQTADFYVKNEERYYYEVVLAPKFNSSYYLGWGLTVKINDDPNRYARLLFMNDHIIAGISSNNSFTLESITNEDYWLGEMTNTTLFEWNAQESHTLKIALDETDNERKYLEFYVDGTRMRANEEDGKEFSTEDSGARRPYLFVANTAEHWSNSLVIDSFRSAVWDKSQDNGWDFYSDTKLATLHSGAEEIAGEFAYSYDELQASAMRQKALRLGVIDLYDGGQPMYDCPSNDKVVNVSQSFTVPESYAKAYFYFDFKKLSELDSDKLELIITTAKGKEVLSQELIGAYATIDTDWQTYGKIDITPQMRKYTGRTLRLTLQASGEPNTYLITDEGDRLYADFLVDNLMVSFIGGSSTIPTLIYYEETVLDNLVDDSVGSFSSSSMPSYSLDPFRARYFADELENSLTSSGISNVRKVTETDLLTFFETGNPAVLIAAHPFTEDLFDGTTNCPLIDWVKHAGGAFIDTQREPLSYYLTENIYGYNLTRVNQADVAILQYDLFKSVVDINNESRVALWSETFDDATSQLYPLGNEIATYKLDEYIGGYLEIMSNETAVQDFYYEFGTSFEPIEMHGKDTGKDPWWNDAWGHRRKITFYYSGDPLLNFPVEVKWKGTDVDWDLFNNDGSDIRFIDEHGDPLLYWIEYFHDVHFREDYFQTRIWVKLPLIKNGYNTFYLYYNNSDCTESLSDGDKVFTFFDDFEKDQLDTDKWEMPLGTPRPLSYAVGNGFFNITDAWKNYDTYNHIEEGWFNYTGAPQDQDQPSYLTVKPLQGEALPDSFVLDFKIELFSSDPTQRGIGGMGLLSYQQLQAFAGIQDALLTEEYHEIRHHPFVGAEEGLTNSLYCYPQNGWVEYRLIKNNDELKIYQQRICNYYYGEEYGMAGSSNWENAMSYSSFGSYTLPTDEIHAIVIAAGAAEHLSDAFLDAIAIRDVRIRPYSWYDFDVKLGDSDTPKEVETTKGTPLPLQQYLSSRGPDRLYHDLLFDDGTGQQQWTAVESHTTIQSNATDENSKQYLKITADKTVEEGDSFLAETPLDLKDYDGTTDITVAYRGYAVQPPDGENTFVVQLVESETDTIVVFEPMEYSEEYDPYCYYEASFTIRKEVLQAYSGTTDSVSLRVGTVIGDGIPPFEAGMTVANLDWLHLSEDIPRHFYEDYYFHLDAYLEDSMRVTLSGLNIDDELVQVVACLGEDFQSYVEQTSDYKRLYFSLPFDSKESPSELVNGSWNAILIDLNMLIGVLGEENRFAYVHAIDFNITGGTTFMDNLWVGQSGPTKQQTGAWIVDELTAFSSDYPVSLSVLEEMKQEIGGFEYHLFGVNEGVRELAFKDQYQEERYPTDDHFTEKPFTDWTFYEEIVTSSNTTGVTARTTALQWNVTSETAQITLTPDIRLQGYSHVYFDLQSNLTLDETSWLADREPLLILEDENGFTKNYTLTFSSANSTRTQSLHLEEEGTAMEGFTLSKVEALTFSLPKAADQAPFTLYIDNLYFIKGLSKTVYSWTGFLQQTGGVITLNGTAQTASLVLKDRFGLGSMEFLAKMSAESGARLGLTSHNNEAGGAYFEYQPSALPQGTGGNTFNGYSFEETGVGDQNWQEILPDNQGFETNVEYDGRMSLFNYEETSNSGEQYFVESDPLDFSEWNGLNDLELSFAFRAMSDCLTSTVTMFQLQFYDLQMEDYLTYTNPSDFDFYRVDQCYHAGQSWIDGGDSGWQSETFTLEPTEFNAYAGTDDRLVLRWGHRDGWSANHYQREYLDYLTITELDCGFSDETENWWNDQWDYRKELTISNPNTEALTDHQVLVELSPSTFDYSHCQADGSDLRFIDEQGNSLSYYIASWDTEGVSKVWVKLPVLSLTGTTIMLYYGNEGALAASDGSSTFLFFEDFEDGSLAGWSTDGAGVSSAVALGDYSAVVKDNWNGADREASLWKEVATTEQVVIELDHYLGTWINNGDSRMEGDFLGVNARTSSGSADWELSYNLAWDDSNSQLRFYTITHGVLSSPNKRVVLGDYTNEYNVEPLAIQQWYHYVLPVAIDRDGLALESGGFLELELAVSGRDTSGNDKQDYFDNIIVRKYAASEPSAECQMEETRPSGEAGGQQEALQDHFNEWFEDSPSFVSDWENLHTPQNSYFELDGSYTHSGSLAASHKGNVFSSFEETGAGDLDWEVSHPGYNLLETAVDYDGKTSLYNYEDVSDSGSKMFATTPLDFSSWTGTTDFELSFQFRAMSDCSYSSVTQFQLRLYDTVTESFIPYTNPTDYDYYSVRTSNKNGQTWLSGKDSGWQVESFILPASDLSSYAGTSDRLELWWGHSDGWSADWFQREYLNYLTLQEQSSGNSYTGYRLDHWTKPYTYQYGVLEGWLYTNHSTAEGSAAVYPVYYDSENFIKLQFHDDSVVINSTVAGVESTTSTSIISWNQKWWQFKLTFMDGSVTGWVKDNSTQTSYPLNEHQFTGTLPKGSVALESLVGGYGSYWYDDLELTLYDKAISWWDYSWQYRNQFVVTNPTSEPLTNQLFKLGLNQDNFDYDYSSPTGADFRIVDNDGTVYSHYLEEYCTGGFNEQTTLYFRVPYLAAEEARNVYLYYGNAVAPSTSTEGLFTFIDHFIATGNWTNTHNDWTHVDSTQEQLLIRTGNNGDGTYSVLPRVFATDFVTTFKFYLDSSQPNSQIFLGVSDDASNTLQDISNGLFLYYSGCTMDNGWTESVAFRTIVDGTMSTTEFTPIETNEWHAVTLEKSGSLVSLMIDHIPIGSLDVTGLGSLNYFYVGGTDYPLVNSAEATARVDDLVLRGQLLPSGSIGSRQHYNIDFQLEGLYAVVSDGSTTKKIPLDLPTFSAEDYHLYTIDRQEDSVRFFIDQQLVAESYEFLPVYIEDDLQHRMNFTVCGGMLQLDWLKYDEQLVTFANAPSNDASFGDVFYDGFGSRPSFPATGISYEEWFYPDSSFNSPHISTSFVSDYDDSLLFEYDGGSPSSTTAERLEYFFLDNESLTNFDLSVLLHHWQEGTGYRNFYVQLFHYDNATEAYTLLGDAALRDAWAGDSYGKYRVRAGEITSQSYDTTEVPQEGTVRFVITRQNSQLTAKVYELTDGSEEELVRSVTTEESYLKLNCIRLHYTAKWGGGTYGPSHSKVWLQELDLDGTLETGTVQYRLRSDVFVDPVAFTFGEGWLGFVKNTPLKPLTVNFADESSEAADWIAMMINDLFANKIRPHNDFYWQMDNEHTTEREMYAFNKFGLQSLNYIHQHPSLDQQTDGVISPIHLDTSAFKPNLAFAPGLVFTDDTDQFFDLHADGFIRHWMINTAENRGLGYSYPDLDLFTENADLYTMGGALFSTTFNQTLWNYGQEMSWSWEDSGSTDWQQGSGLQTDEYSSTSILRLGEQSLLPDPGFELPKTLWNETSYHYLYVEDDDPSTNSSYFDYRAALDTTGWPGPSVYCFNPNKTVTTIHLGVRLDNLHDYDLSGINNYLLEFDYHVSDANYTDGFGPFGVYANLYSLSNTSAAWHNPLNSTDFQDRFEYVSGSYHYLPLYSNSSLFDHFSFDGYSSLFQQLATESEEHFYVLDFKFVFDPTGAPYKQNQTLLIDNLSLTPYNVTGAQGHNTGFGLTTNATTIDWNNLGGSSNEEAGLVCHYPFIELTDVLTTDYIHDGADYEFVTTVYDPINDYTIRLHYCWSGDDLLLGNHTHGEYQINGQVIDYYHHCSDQILYPHPQTFYLNVYDSLNNLVKLSLLPLAREHIVHRLGFEFRLDQNATNFQIGHLTILGSTPWQEYIVPLASGDNWFDTTDIYGDLTGKSSVAVLATSYLWGNTQEIVQFRLDAEDCDVALFVNDQYVVHYDQNDLLHNHTRSPQLATILRPGLNKVSVQLMNKEGSAGKFRFWVIDQSFNETKDNSEITTTVIRNDLLESSRSTIGDGYPIVRTSYGFGSINCWAMDFDQSFGSDSSVSHFVSNLLNYEHHQRKPLIAGVMKKFVNAIEWNLNYKSQDRPYDRWNSDDPYQNIANPYSQLTHTEGIARKAMEFFPQILATTRKKNQSAIAVDHTTLNSLLEAFFTEAQFTGNTVTWLPVDELGIIENPPQYPDHNGEFFPGFNVTQTIFHYAKFSDGLTKSVWHHFGIMRGLVGTDENDVSYSQVLLQLAKAKIATNRMDDYPTAWGNDWSSCDITSEFGSYRIYNDSFVVVDSAIKSDTGKVFLEGSVTSGQSYSLLEVLNATAYCITELITYASKTDQESFFSQATNFLYDRREFSIDGLDITTGLADYMLTMRYQMHDTAVAECKTYLIEREQEYYFRLFSEHPELYYTYLLEDLGYDAENFIDTPINPISRYTNPDYFDNVTAPEFHFSLFIPFLMVHDEAISDGVNPNTLPGRRYYHEIAPDKMKIGKSYPTVQDSLEDGMQDQIKEWIDDPSSIETVADAYEAYETPLPSIFDQYRKRSDVYFSFYQLFQAVERDGWLTSSSTDWLTNIASINNGFQRIDEPVNTVNVESYMTTKIVWTIAPTKIDEANGHKFQIYAWNPNIEGISSMQRQSMIQLGVVEYNDMDIFSGMPIYDIFQGATAAFPSMKMQLRINRKQFSQLMHKVFGTVVDETDPHKRPDPVLKGVLSLDEVVTFIDNDGYTHTISILGGYNSLEDRFSSDILVEHIYKKEGGTIVEEEFKMKGIAMHGARIFNQKLYLDGNTWRREDFLHSIGILVSTGTSDNPASSVVKQPEEGDYYKYGKTRNGIVPKTLLEYQTGEDLLTDGYGFIPLYQKPDGTTVYIWLKDGWFVSTEEGNARNLPANYQTTGFHQGYLDGSGVAGFEDTFVETKKKKTEEGAIKEILSVYGSVFEISNERSTKATDAVVVSYQPSFDHLVDMYRNALRVGNSLRGQRNDLNPSSVRGAFKQFAVFLAIPLALQRMKNGKNSYSATIEVQKAIRDIFDEEFWEIKFGEWENRHFEINEKRSNIYRILERFDDIIKWTEKLCKDENKAFRGLKDCYLHEIKINGDLDKEESTKTNIRELLLANLEMKNEALRKLIYYINTEKLDEGTYSLTSIEELLFECLTHCTGVMPVNLADLGFTIVSKVATIDAYHLRKTMLHHMTGYMGLNYERDFTYDEENEILKYTPQVGMIKQLLTIDAYFSKYIEGPDKTNVKKDGKDSTDRINNWFNFGVTGEQPSVIYQNGRPVLPSASMTRFPTRITYEENGISYVKPAGTHVDLATQTGIRHFLDHLVHLTNLLGVKPTNHNEKFLELLDMLGLPQRLEKLMDKSQEVMLAKLTDGTARYFDYTQTENTQTANWIKTAELSFPFLHGADFERITGIKDQTSGDFSLSAMLGAGLLVEPTKAQGGNSYTVMDFIVNSILFVDKDGKLFKYVTAQELDKDGNPLRDMTKPDRWGRGEAVWGTYKIEITPNDFIDITDGIEKPADAHTVIVEDSSGNRLSETEIAEKIATDNPYLRQIPYFRNGEDNQKQVTVLVLTDQESYITQAGRGTMFEPQDVEVVELAELDEEGIKEFLAEQWNVEEHPDYQDLLDALEITNLPSLSVDYTKDKLAEIDQVWQQKLRKDRRRLNKKNHFYELLNELREDFEIEELLSDVSDDHLVPVICASATANEVLGRAYPFSRGDYISDTLAAWELSDAGQYYQLYFRPDGFTDDNDEQSYLFNQLEKPSDKIENLQKDFLRASIYDTFQSTFQKHIAAETQKQKDLLRNAIMKVFKKKESLISKIGTFLFPNLALMRKLLLFKKTLAPEQVGLPTKPKTSAKVSVLDAANNAKEKILKSVRNLPTTVVTGATIGVMSNLLQQAWMHPLLQGFVWMGYNDLKMDNALTVVDKDLDGLYNSTGERGSYYERYALDYEDEETNNQHNLTRHVEGLKQAFYVWLTDYLELDLYGIGGDIWEFVNVVLAGRQLARIELGMVPVDFTNITTVAKAWRGMRQLKGKDVPDNPRKTVDSLAFRLFWQSVMFVAGAIVTTISETITTACQGAAVGFASGGVAGAIAGLAGGAATGLVEGTIEGSISIAQSFVAGHAVTTAWDGVWEAIPTTIWEKNLFHSWTTTLKGDADREIFWFNFQKFLYKLGTELPHPEALDWLYINTYFDFGLWAGAFDSLLSPIASAIIVGAYGATVGAIVGLLSSSLGFWTGFWVGGFAGGLIGVAICVVVFGVLWILKKIGVFDNRNDSPKDHNPLEGDI